MEKQALNRIAINSRVMVGKPVIRGTRIPVDLIVKLIANGLTINEILEDYPQLKREDIMAALEYVAEIARGESVFPIKEDA